MPILDARRCRWGAPSLTALFVLGLASPAAAHIELLNPANQYEDPMAYQKFYPCGDQANMPPQNGPTALSPGEIITIELNEYVGHNGHFRVAIDPDSDAFVDPSSFSDFYNAPNVYLDDVEDPADGTGIRTFDFEVPDLDCDPCFMQVMQIMYNPSGELNGGDFYYQCAQVVIDGQGTSTTGADTSGTGEPGDGSSSEGGSTGDMTGPPDPSAGNTDDTGGAPSTTGAQTATGGMADDDPGADEGCGCRTTQSPPMAWLLLALVLPLRRRRAR